MSNVVSSSILHLNCINYRLPFPASPCWISFCMNDINNNGSDRNSSW